MFRTSIYLAFCFLLVWGFSGFAEGAGMVAHWRLENDATDSAGNINGTLMNGAGFTTDAAEGSYALALNSSQQQYVDFGNPPELPNGRSPRSMCGWAKTNTIASGWRWIAAYGSEGTSLAMFIGLNGTSLYGGGYGDDVYISGFWEVDVWHHICLTYDGNVARLYADGEEVTSAAKNWNLVLNRAHIGRQVNNELEFWNGLIDDVQIYNRALTENEILAVMEGHVGGLSQNASQPDPADGSIYADTSVSLSWVAGIYAVSHDVFFGDNFDYVNNGVRRTFQGNQTETVFTVGLPGGPYPEGLVPGTTYYWRIDEVGADGITIYKGDVWSFTVQSVSSKHFEITYYDNYNYDTGRWDAWQGGPSSRDAWDDKYLADESSGKTVFTDHAFTSIDVFDLKGNLFSKDGHDSWGEDWNPIRSIGDNVSGESPHHVFAALFRGYVYLEEGDTLMVSSDDDAYVFLDENTRWGQEVLSVVDIPYFGSDSMRVSAAQAGYHLMTVKFVEVRDIHSGIEITLNGVPIRSVELPSIEDFETGDFSKYSWMPGSNWIISQSEKYSGDYSAEAGAIGDNESTTLEITLDCIPGNITFYRKVSSEVNFDYLKFYIDGEKKEAWSGEEDWARVSFQVEEGTRTFKWMYSKDDSNSEGDDTAWIDDIVFPLKNNLPVSPEPPDGGFDIYLDDFGPNIVESSMISNGLLDFYYARNTASGDCCIHWTGVDQYNNISFQFSPVKDLSKMVDEGYVVDFWVRCNSNVTFDIGFVDTKTGDRTDHPWQNRFKIDRNVAVWDGSWDHLEIPLISFYMYGSWDNDRWYGASGEFDWTATEYFLIVAEDSDLRRVDIYFDEIRVVHP